MTTEKFKELQELVWQTHCEKGFDKIENSDVRNLNLIIGEISEAYEEFRKGRRELDYVDNKPECEFIELADVVIRIMNFWKNKKNYIDDTDGSILKDDYKAIEIDRMYGGLFYAAATGVLSIVIIVIDAYLSANNQNLEELIKIKNAYNHTREYLHGKNF